MSFPTGDVDQEANRGSMNSKIHKYVSVSTFIHAYMPISVRRISMELLR